MVLASLVSEGSRSRVEHVRGQVESLLLVDGAVRRLSLDRELHVLSLNLGPVLRIIVVALNAKSRGIVDAARGRTYLRLLVVV